MAAKTILLDTGPFGIAANPRTSPATEAFNRWLFAQVGQVALICISEVADYEVRRELIRGQRFNSLRKLDILQVRFVYLPITARDAARRRSCGRRRAISENQALTRFRWMAT